MAAKTLEDKIKETLDGRTIQPSADAWSALANRLDAHDKSKNRRTVWWLGIAASVVGIVLVTSLFFRTDLNSQPHQKTVDTQEKTNPLAKEIIKSEAVEVAESAISETENPIEEPQNLSRPTLKQIQKMNAVSKVSSEKEAIAHTTFQKEVVESHNQILDTSLTIANEKVTEFVPQTNALQAKTTTTDEAIDALLNRAQSEITLQKLNTENTKTVDANVLLQDVETDLQQSFRDKVFEALQTSYDKVKTAVAQRNY